MSEDDLTKQRYNQFWNKVFDNVQWEYIPTTRPSESTSRPEPFNGEPSASSTDGKSVSV